MRTKTELLAELERSKSIASELFGRDCFDWFENIQKKIENYGNKTEATVYVLAEKRGNVA